MNNEIWKDIEGYGGLYQVSNLGNVKNIKRNIYLQPNLGDNYLRVNLCKKGKCKTKPIHRLVAIAFIPNLENKPYVDHIDGNKLNNNVKNLRWATEKENQLNQNTIKNCKPIKCIETGERYFSIREAARSLKVSRTVITKALKNNAYTVSGYHFEYIMPCSNSYKTLRKIKENHVIKNMENKKWSWRTKTISINLQHIYCSMADFFKSIFGMKKYGGEENGS